MQSNYTAALALIRDLICTTVPVYSLFAAQIIPSVAVGYANCEKIVNKFEHIFGVCTIFFLQIYTNFRGSKYVRGTSAEVDA